MLFHTPDQSAWWVRAERNRQAHTYACINIRNILILHTTDQSTRGLRTERNHYDEGLTGAGSVTR